ncbi:MAG: NAD(P)/FAD-dependent oxidoreductase [Saprospiraceae bacterium]|nr:NAD(P)/FAD-dependent oxidoreductase [Saprospiraceae bacterium]
MQSEAGKIQDVVIVGAGISGIGTAYWLQEKCPNKEYIILEGRESIGGTWDLFRYPGVRSDSDMFTFGYKFKPWKEPKALSDGASIRKYLTEVIQENGIDKKIHYGHKVVSADWSSEEKHWTLDVKTKEKSIQIKARFLYMCTGYYDYKEAHRPRFDGEENYRGDILQPQFWPEGYNYKGEKVVIIGSGATAVTLVPAMSDDAAHVTMLQRSPTYIMNLPNNSDLFFTLKKVMPESWAYKITRRRNIILNILIFWLCRTFPSGMKKLFMKGAASQLPEGYDVDKHFNPKYKPWDQRLCVVPDGDLFETIKEGKASVITEQVDQFDANGIVLQSGESLEADVIVVATGLKIKILGGAEIKVDGKVIDPKESMVYKGMMISGIPNFAIAFGYTNAPWTLKTDLTANYMCKLINHMDKKGYRTVIPRKDPSMEVIPFLNINSGYVERAQNILPQQGAKRPWRVYQNYFKDMMATRFGKIEDDFLEFGPKIEKYAT